jgi:apolipoprotein N-acyltransferase
MERKQSLNWSIWVRILAGAGLGVLSGLAFMLAFPPYEWWPLVFVGWVPMLAAQFWLMPPKWSAIPSALAIGVWLQGYLGPVFAPVGTFMVWLPVFAAGTSYLTDLGLRKFNLHTGYRWFIPAGLVNWAGSEMIRLFIPIAGTWAFIAYPLYRQVWLIQPVSIFGIIGMGVLVMLFNYVAALALLDWLYQRWQWEGEPLPNIPTGLARKWSIVLLGTSAGWLLLSLMLLRPPSGESLRVAAVQPAVSPVVTANFGEKPVLAEIYERMISQTREAAADGAQLVVWPEGSFLWDPQVEDRLNLTDLARTNGIYLASGYLVIEEEGFRNEATVINPQGEFLGVFGKDHPVVFGGETSLTRGTYPVYDTPLGKLGTIICYDLDYTDTARKLARAGAQVIAVPSNDWGSIAEKHYTHVVFRAVENRVAMIKADGGFDSAIIDPYGRIVSLAAFPEGGEATLVSDVQSGSGKGTITTRLGDWVGWLALAGMLFFAFGSGWLEKREKI